MTKAQMMAMSDAEVKLRLENVRLRVKIVEMESLTRVRSQKPYLYLGDLIQRKNRLQTQEKKWREEIARRGITKKIGRIQEAIDELNARSGE